MYFNAMLRPGQGFRPFTVLRVDSDVNKKGRSSGRVAATGYEECGVLYGIISQASPREVEQWKQAGHPITHTIVQRGTSNRAYAQDILELAVGCQKPRKFIVQGTPHDPGELGHFLVYHVLEREDLQ